MIMFMALSKVFFRRLGKVRKPLLFQINVWVLFKSHTDCFRILHLLCCLEQKIDGKPVLLSSADGNTWWWRIYRILRGREILQTQIF